MRTIIAAGATFSLGIILLLLFIGYWSPDLLPQFLRIHTFERNTTVLVLETLLAGSIFLFGIERVITAFKQFIRRHNV